MTNTDDTQQAADRAADDFAEFCRTAKREVITLSPEAYDAFVKLLEAPPQPNARLRALMAKKSFWELSDAPSQVLLTKPSK
jgi:uncharacterized protein (DUF1778 family)